MTDWAKADQEAAENSDAYHAHVGHPADCESHREFFGGECPCQDYVAWREA